MQAATTAGKCPAALRANWSGRDASTRSARAPATGARLAASGRIEAQSWRLKTELVLSNEALKSGTALIGSLLPMLLRDNCFLKERKKEQQMR